MSFENNYSITDKLFHYIAFASPIVQKTLCDLENDLYKNKINSCTSHNEVFVAGLPRSGTTLILEILYGTGEFSTYTYRNMPFILSPLIWDKISGAFQKKGIEKEIIQRFENYSEFIEYIKEHKK